MKKKEKEKTEKLSFSWHSVRIDRAICCQSNSSCQK